MIMAAPKFEFTTDSYQSEFTVVSFKGNEGISQLYRYEIELKASDLLEIDLDTILDEGIHFTMINDEGDFPVHGILAEFSEIRTARNYTYYSAVLVPRLWKLSVSRTNEIFTDPASAVAVEVGVDTIPEMDIKDIITNVLEDALFILDTDFVLDITGTLIQREFVCQFRESDFSFISRLMEHEGLYYFFEQQDGIDKLIISDSQNYTDYKDSATDIIFDAAAEGESAFQSVQSWICRNRQLPAEVTVRDYNPDNPMLDLSADADVIQGSDIRSEYLYGENISDTDDALHLADIRAEELLARKTQFYAETGVFNLHAGFTFAMDAHPKSKFNGSKYLIIEVNHEGNNLDSSKKESNGNYYTNSLVAIESDIAFRPQRKTPKPRFYGTMTAFIYAEASSSSRDVVQIDGKGRYQVTLPFDRRDSGELKASAWIRMATPYVGQNQGMYFPMGSGTEVLLTFINGDPDRPVISAALPNSEKPPLLNSENNWSSLVTNNVMQMVTSNRHVIVDNRISIDANATDIATNSAEIAGPAVIRGTEYVNDGGDQETAPTRSMLPPWTVELEDTAPPGIDDPQLIKFGLYNDSYVPIVDDVLTTTINEETNKLNQVNTDRGSGDTYVYASGRTFAYPQHERVYFIGTFHEDFHVKDDFITANADETFNSWTGIREQWNFPEPGGKYPTDTDPTTDLDVIVNPEGIRGVSEDKRWGDQMNFAYGRSFNWGGGPALGGGATGSFAVYNYGNGYTENLHTLMGGTSDDDDFEYKDQKDKWTYTEGWKPGTTYNMASALAPIAIGLKAAMSYPILGAAAAPELIWKLISKYAHESRSDLAEAWTIKPSNTAVEKTFGHTYSYQMGLAIDIHEGNSISKTYGHCVEEVDGNTESLTWGDNLSTTMGSSSEVFMGSKYEFNLGTADSLTVGFLNEIKLSAETATHLGAKLETFWGAQLGLKMGPDTQLGTETLAFWNLKGDIATTDLNDKIVALEKKTTMLNNAAIDLSKKTIKLDSGEIEIGDKKLKID